MAFTSVKPKAIKLRNSSDNTSIAAFDSQLDYTNTNITTTSEAEI